MPPRTYFAFYSILVGTLAAIVSLFTGDDAYGDYEGRLATRSVTTAMMLVCFGFLWRLNEKLRPYCYAMFLLAAYNILSITYIYWLASRP